MMETILTKIDDMQSLMTVHGKGIMEIKSDIRSQLNSDISRCEEEKLPLKDYSAPRERKKSHEEPLDKEKSQFSMKPPKPSEEESKDEDGTTGNDNANTSLTAKFGKVSNG